MLRQAEQIAGENTLPPDERFFVIETDDGYAIWDDLTEAIYIDDEGVSEEFKSEWQANDYLEQVKKSVSERKLPNGFMWNGQSRTHLLSSLSRKKPSHLRLLSASRSAHGYRPLICTPIYLCPNGTPLTLLPTKCRRLAKKNASAGIWRQSMC